MLLSELQLRRPTFQADSVPVVMADGQPWYLPRPYVEFFPRYEEGKLVTVASETHLGPEFDRLVEAALPSDEGGVSFLAYFELTAFLLRLNYDLLDEAFGVLLRHRRNDEASVERMQAVLDVATGQAPKAPAAGDGSPA